MSPGAAVRLLSFVLVGSLLPGCADEGWRNARNDSAGLAPSVAETSDAVIQVYGAPVYGWRGVLADHTWFAMKPEGAADYTIYQVLGWRLRRGQSAVSIGPGIPDRHWFGSPPELLLDLRGAAAAPLLERVAAAADAYPYADRYTMWPGPNSNSFVQWIALEVPELDLRLPWRAWGTGWMVSNYEGRE